MKTVAHGGLRDVEHLRNGRLAQLLEEVQFNKIGLPWGDVFQHILHLVQLLQALGGEFLRNSGVIREAVLGRKYPLHIGGV